MSVETLRRRKLGWRVGLLSGFVLIAAPGMAAAVEMLVYNSGDVGSISPGRYESPTTTLLAPNFPSDDYQCGGGTLELLHLFVSRADLMAASTTALPCTSAGTGNAVCGFDLTLSITNVSSAEADRFWIHLFTSNSPSEIVGVVSGENKDVLRINGVKTGGWDSFPVSVGAVQLKRGADPGVSTCPSACDLDWCAELSVDSAKIVGVNLDVQELSDTVPVLRLPEPSGNVLCGAGVLLVLGLAGRRRRAVAG